MMMNFLKKPRGHCAGDGGLAQESNRGSQGDNERVGDG